jgi:hypothetical protein
VSSYWRLRWLAGAALVVALFLAVGSDTGGLSSPGFTIGRENSWFRVQNIGTANATIGAAYMSESGAVLDADTYPGIQIARAAPPFYQATNTALPRGYRGSSTIYSDQNVGALLFRTIKDGAGVQRFGAVTSTLPAPAKRVYLPLVYRNYGFNDSWNTRIIVMNTSATKTAQVGISYWEAGAGSALPLSARDPASISQWINIPPLGTVRRDVIDMTALGDQWIGSVMIDVKTDDQIIVANAETWNRDHGSFASYTGLCFKIPNPCFSSPGASTNVLLPIIYHDFGFMGQWQSYVMIQPHNNIDTDVEVHFKGTAGGAPFETTYGPFEVKTSRICYLASANAEAACADEGTSNGPLPADFVGSAQVREPTDSVPLAVIASTVTTKGPSHRAYSGIMTADSTGSPGPPYKVFLPLVYRTYGWHGPGGNLKGWNSWFQVQVADGSTAQITTTFYRDNGSTANTQPATIAGSGGVYQYSNAALGAGYIGSALILSDKPIAVIATVTSDAYVGDADASYEGILP